MPRLKEENERIKDQRREKIEQAALRVFAARGLAATKISDIASAADMSLGLIYHYYQNKEDLFESLVKSAVNAAIEVLREAMAQSLSPREKLHQVYINIFESFRQNPYTFMVVLQASTSETTSANLRQMLANQGQEYQLAFTQLVEEGQKAGQFRAGNTAEMVSLLFVFIQGIALSLASGDPLSNLTPDSILRTIEAFQN